MTSGVLFAVAGGYAVFLFAIASFAERAAQRKKTQRAWLRSPWVYTLSLSVYCTAWTFYGAVGYAARSGLEFMTIYLGPTLVFIGWWWFLRKLVRIGRTQRITSVADLLSSRYGKSNLVAVLVTVLAVMATTPYIALQLQSVALSFVAIASAGKGTAPAPETIALWLAMGLIAFTVVFGTRSLNMNERHDGIVAAIAVEALVKLFALLAVGVFVVWGIASGPGDVLARLSNSEMSNWQSTSGRWVGLTILSAAVIVCLPRMFQVMVVEAPDERHLATASWAFPAYLMAMCLFVLPIAVVGLDTLGTEANPDLFVLTLPLAQGQEALALLAFIGGFSAATSMVIVASVALSTMIANHIVMPLWLASQPDGATVSGDMRATALTSRRLSIAGIILMGYIYYRLTGGTEALAAMGLISFVGIAQVMPALVGGLYWRGGTRAGASSGLAIGLAVWLYVLVLPVFDSGQMSFFSQGPFGIAWLKPSDLFGLGGGDALLLALILSLMLNCTAYCVVSLFTFPSPLERLQGARFVGAFESAGTVGGWRASEAGTEDLLVMSQRILGPHEAQRLFRRGALAQGKQEDLPDPTPEFIAAVEKELAGSVGAATAHAMVAQIIGGAMVSVEDLMAVADEAAQILEYSSKLEAQSVELEQTAIRLREANERLWRLSEQKDAFLSQVSHELRTPMTSIRAFSEILSEDLELEQRLEYARIIHEESLRLTRLLDDLLDLSVLESGRVSLELQPVCVQKVLHKAQRSLGPDVLGRLKIDQTRVDGLVYVAADADRLAQVFINLMTNAAKYCSASEPTLSISLRQEAGSVLLDFTDNGAGIPLEDRAVIFEKFSRLSDQTAAGSAGLGLAICMEIMRNLGGSICYIPGQGGACFRLRLPCYQSS